MNDSERVDAMLPLKHTWFHMLLALAGSVLHGYAIRKEVERRSDGKVRLWPTTLYSTIARMLEEGLIADAPTPPDDDDDVERKYYSLTDFGRRVLRAETARLEDLVQLSHARSNEQPLG